MSRFSNVSAFAVSAALITATASAQQPGNQNPGLPPDFKPAQAASPAANPMRNQNSAAPQGQERMELNQGEGRATTTNGQVQGREEQEGQNLDQIFAACLLTGNQGEVELGKLAVERATNSDVKEFAEQMVKDHNKQVETLQKLVGSQEPSDRRSQIEKQIAERCTENLKKELESKSGKEFDAAYVGTQIGGHMHMQAELAVLSDQATGQLRGVIKEAQPVVDKHLAHAKKLMEQLDKGADRRQASKDSKGTER